VACAKPSTSKLSRLRRMKRRQLWLDLTLTAASGAAWGLCFGRESLPWLGWIALAPLFFVLGVGGRRHPSRRRAALLGLAHGIASWLVATPWIPPTLVTFGHLPTALGWALFGLMSIYLGLFRAAFAVLTRRVCQARPAFVLIVLPAIWVSVEWLRGNALGPLNFPWNLAAYAWVDVPGTLPLAAWIGPYGISYLVVAVQLGVALAVVTFAGSRRPASLLPSVTAVGLVTILLTLGAHFSHPAPTQRTTHPVRLIQPNQKIQLSAGAATTADYRELVARSAAECDSGEPTLLVWPESAAWPHSWEGSAVLRRDLLHLASRGCSTVLNTPRFESREVYYNSAFLVSTATPPVHYDKRFLVPWGEHVPFAKLLPFVANLARMAGNFTPGKEAKLLPWADEHLGMALCYEVIFPEAMAADVRSGASLLVNISNDAWYGDSSAPRQLFRAARFRAAESRRVLLRAALTGISGVIGRRGEVRSRLEIGRSGVLRQRVAGSRELTPYVRFPYMVPLFSLLVAVSGIFRTWTRTRRHHDATQRADGTL
jgi:apolipoprotein N-acyltransferase